MPPPPPTRPPVTPADTVLAVNQSRRLLIDTLRATIVCQQRLSPLAQSWSCRTRQDVGTCHTASNSASTLHSTEISSGLNSIPDAPPVPRSKLVVAAR